MITAILLLFIYELLESTLIALTSTKVLTALGFTVPITAAMTALAVGTSIRCNNIVVKSLCLNKKSISITTSYSLVLSTLIISGLALICYSFSEQILVTLGNGYWLNSEATINHTNLASEQSDYINNRYGTWIFLGIVWQVNAILRALNHTLLASYLMIFWLVVKGILAITLLYPNSPLYVEGLATLALVHGISDLLFALISLYFLNKKSKLVLPTLKILVNHVSEPKFTSLLVITQQLITPLSMAILTMMAASYNANYVAAFALIFKLDALLLLVPMVLTTSMPAIIGINFWSGFHKRVKQAYYWVFGIIIISQVAIAMLLNLTVDFWSNLLCPHEGITEHLRFYLVWLPWGYIGAACAIVYQSTLNAKDEVIAATLLGICHRLILVLPLAWLGMTIGEFDIYPSLMFAHLTIGGFVIYLFMLTNRKSNTIQITATPNELNLLKSK